MPATPTRRHTAAIRRELIGLAAAGRLVVPIGRTFPFADAPTAFGLLMGDHPAGKLALVKGKKHAAEDELL